MTLGPLRTTSWSALPLAAVCIALPAAAQTGSVPSVTLTRPEAVFDEPFSRLTAVRELSDGRVIVTDLTERSVRLLDFTRQSARAIGSVGQGPGEYSIPAALIPYPGDTTLVADISGRKYLKITPNGTLAADITLPAPESGGNMMVSVGGRAGRFDALGRVYSEGAPFVVAADGSMQQLDSTPVIRMDLRTARTDTVVWVAAPRFQIQQSNTGRGGGNISVSMGGIQPFVAQPAWAVAPDGRIALLTPEPYRVTWVGERGARVEGQPIPYERVRVTEGEKEGWRTSMANSPPTAVSVTRSSGAGSDNITTRPAQVQEPSSWPEYKHPYAGSGVAIAPDGTLWVLKQLPVSQRLPTYDVIGARGELLRRVVLPERSRLLGFGASGAVYLVQRDADDLEYVQRFRIAAR